MFVLFCTSALYSRLSSFVFYVLIVLFVICFMTVVNKYHIVSLTKERKEKHEYADILKNPIRSCK